jgi:arsenate reductase
MSQRRYNVLFLCTGNSARSILAEALLRQRGSGRFATFSAGSFPKGKVNPYALALLRSRGLPTEGLRSKSWEEFSRPGTPQMDFIFTVCDQAAEEPCPIWPGHPATAHWGLPDPAAVDGSEERKREAFLAAYETLETRIRLFATLDPETLDAAALTRALATIGKAGPTPR